MSKLTRKNTDWGRRITAAKRRGGFTDEDGADVCSGSRCPVGELFGMDLISADLRLWEMCLHTFPDLVPADAVLTADIEYTELLKIRNEEYE